MATRSKSKDKRRGLLRVENQGASNEDAQQGAEEERSDESTVLQRKQEQCKRRIGFLIDRVDQQLSKTASSVTVVEVYDRELNKEYEKFMNLNEELEEVLEDAASQNDLQDVWEQVSTAVIECRAKVKGVTDDHRRDRMDPTGSPNASENSTVGETERANKIKLPEIRLPTFDGDVLQFSTFWDMFRSTVDSDAGLEPNQKMSYLKTALKGKALAAVDPLTVNDLNYEVAVRVLKKRFMKPRIVIEAHVSALLDIAQQPRSDAKSLRYLHDAIDLHLSSLLMLCRDQNRSEVTATEVLLAMLKRKLPTSTLKKWEGKIIEDETQHTLKNMLAFLEKEAEIEETAQVRYVPKSNQDLTKHTASPRLTPDRRQTVVFHSTQSTGANRSVNGVCVYCNGAVHQDVKTCPRMPELSVDERKTVATQNRLCYRCLRPGHTIRRCRASRCGVAGCKGNHHALLHFERDVSCNTNEQGDDHEENPSSVIRQSKLSIYAASFVDPTTRILQVASAMLITLQGCHIPVTVLLDQGSQTSLIEKSFAEAHQLQGTNERVFMNTPGHVTEDMGVQKCVSFALAPIGKDSMEVQMCALTMSQMCDSVRMQCNPQLYSHLKGLSIEGIQTDSTVIKADVLVGVDFYWEFFTGEVVKGPRRGDPAAMKSIFGWLISGPMMKRCVTGQSTTDRAFSVKNVRIESRQEWNYHDLRRFWESEAVPHCNEDQPKSVVPDDEVYSRFVQSTAFEEGRYHVRIPWKPEALLPDNFNVAYKRFRILENRLSLNPRLAKAYKAAIQEYEELGFAEEVPKESTSNRVWYLPHHGVFKEERETTKTRVVFDGASKFKGVSINQCIHPGPGLQPDIFGVLIRFRLHQIGLTADIKKMFLQVGVHEEDRDVLRYLWRNHPSQRLRTMRFKRVCFGLNVSPFLAIATVKLHCNSKAPEFPKVCQEIDRNMYVDDLVTGTTTTSEARDFVNQAVTMMASGGFDLTKWISNDVSSLEHLPSSQKGGVMQTLNKLKSTKVLGVPWNLNTDRLGVASQKEPQVGSKITKRKVLQRVAGVFDPLGVVAPFMVIGKVLLQDLWKMKSDWDEEVPPRESQRFQSWTEALNGLESISIPRYLFASLTGDAPCRYSLQAFGDASARAYGSVVYLRTTTHDSNRMQFVVAKSRIAPVKQVSMPKLELMAALLTARLLHYVIEQSGFSIEESWCWSDSQVVVTWIKSQKSSDVFVRNRVRQILQLTGAEQWHHCPGCQNPADLISRGLTLEKLQASSLWFHGPKSLSGNVQMENGSTDERGSGLITTACRSFTVSREAVMDPDRYPLPKFLAVTGWIRRFSHNARSSGSKQSKLSGYLNAAEMKSAKHLHVRLIQEKHFPDALECSKRGVCLPRGHRLAPLDPKVDENGILRVGGRLGKSTYSLGQKHPIILPRGDALTRRIVENVHEKCLHAGPEHVLARLRQEFWVTGGRSLVKQVIGRCALCRFQRTKRAGQKMGNLPKERVQESRVFENVGLDFAGPLHLKGNRKGEIGYICIFVCTASRAVHLELSTDMSVNKFMQCLKRFVGRRGPLKSIFSDNAKTFHAANDGLQKGLKDLVARAPEFAAREGYKWHFITERAPWQGGMYERLVRSVKAPLRKVVGRALLTYEEMTTVLVEVENQINSRPLTTVSDNVEDFEALTPMHFIAGVKADMDVFHSRSLESSTSSQLRRRWLLQQRLVNSVWKRWRKEYLHKLQERKVWNQSRPNVKVNDVVILEEEGVPRGKWKLCRITSVFHGQDGLVRSVGLRTSKGQVLKRPVQRVFQLEAEGDPSLPAPEDVANSMQPSAVS